ncbi:MAG: CAP domain-containing protein [Paracoccaceae bacterium]|nr:CAP domain-containing protein [Paracoccaceae bacterium]
MRPRLTLVVLLLLALRALPATACTLAPVPGEAQPLPNGAGVDGARLDATIRARVNLARCRAGLGALAPSSRLQHIAEAQGRWMAERRDLTHDGGPQGLASLTERLAASGLPYRMGAENIATASLYRVDGITVYTGAKPCQFRDANRRPIPVQSYASLADEVVAHWLASPPHRQNILTPGLRWTGAGAGFDRGGAMCGTFYVAQDFAG